MGTFIIVCFVVGLIFFMLLSEGGRGCLGALFTGAFGIVLIIVVGAAIIGGLIFLVSLFF